VVCSGSGPGHSLASQKIGMEVIEMPRSAYSKGARKALRAMQKRYGAKRGKQVFYAKANKYGRRGQSNARKANSVFSKGAHRVRSRKRKR